MEIYSVRDLQAVARARRRELGLTQLAAAARAGVSRKWLSAFERGASAAELPLVLRLLAALQLTVDVCPGDSLPTDQRDETQPHAIQIIDLDEHLRAFAAPPPAEGSQL